MIDDELSPAVSRLNAMTNVLAAVSGLLDELIGCLQRLASAAVCVEFIFSAVRLAMHPSVSPEQLLAPVATGIAVAGRGVLAKRRSKQNARDLPDGREH